MVDMDAIKYMTGATGDYLESTGLAAQWDIGLMVQPGNRYDLRVDRYGHWCGDNGAFTTNVGGFSPSRFRALYRRPELRAQAARCRFVAAPDVLHVFPDGSVRGDARATLNQFTFWAIEIANLGYPVALVAQDGLEEMLDDVPWDLVDVLFIGGSTEWKLGQRGDVRACIARAKLEGKKVHMGRVNSYKRLTLADSWDVDTADGTFLAFGPTKNVPRLVSWLQKVREDRHARNILRNRKQEQMRRAS